MSLRKLSGAAAAGSRESYATTALPSSSSTVSVGGGTTGGGGGGAPGGSGSKAYSSHLAIQSDATKYRGKYKELKRKVQQIEMENDKLHFKTLRIKRNIQRLRLERAILYERLEAELEATDPGAWERPATEVTAERQAAQASTVSEPKQGATTTAAEATDEDATIDDQLMAVAEQRDAAPQRPRPSIDFDSPPPPAPAETSRVTPSVHKGRTSRAHRDTSTTAAPIATSTSRPSIDFSPSPEDTTQPSNGTNGSGTRSARPSSSHTTTPSAVKPEAGRSSMKITLKRHNHNNGGAASGK